MVRIGINRFSSLNRFSLNRFHTQFSINRHTHLLVLKDMAFLHRGLRVNERDRFTQTGARDPNSSWNEAETESNSFKSFIHQSINFFWRQKKQATVGKPKQIEMHLKKGWKHELKMEQTRQAGVTGRCDNPSWQQVSKGVRPGFCLCLGGLLKNCV